MVSTNGDVLRREAQALGELAVLLRDPVYAGRGLPRGDGRLVLVLPGLFGNDLYLQPLHLWLRRLGYAPVRSTLAINAGCPNRLREQVDAALRRRRRHHPGPIALLGHSRGGMLAWALASRLQAEASHLVLLGSPVPTVVAMLREGSAESATQLVGTAAAPDVVEAGARALRLLDPDCTVPACGCPYPDDIRRPLDAATRVLAIHSREDQIVSPAACVVDGADNREVGGTHSGLVYNRAVYAIVAQFLAAGGTAPAGR